MKTSESIYYSLDIETSGFDPEKNEILEIGFVGFKLGGDKFKIIEQWSKVFRPKTEVSAHVLGLTGITPAELEKGERLNDYLFVLQSKLGHANIVGHNIGFDVGFLEKNGLKFSGKIIDTMDLVQFLLPTHHSYNLENLMHTFNVPHRNAHRALADAKACCALLEKLLGVHQYLPADVKKQIQGLARAANAPWAELLEFPAKPIAWQQIGGRQTSATQKADDTMTLENQSLYVADQFTHPIELARQLAAQASQNLLIVVPKRYQVLQLWQQNIAHGIFEPEQGFNEEKFNALLENPPANLGLAKFLMKIAVWQATNWQSECLLDLNLSFFGGQFKELVSGRPLPGKINERVLCCDHKTFLELKGEDVLKDRHIVIIGLPEFERAITATLGERSSWGYILYLLKSIYDPETNIGQLEFKETIGQLLADADLFYGLANALLQKFSHGWGDVLVDDYFRNSDEYAKILRAAEHFREKLQQANGQLRSKGIADFAAALESFFLDQPRQVKWISFGERTSSFHSLPLDIAPIVKDCFAQFKSVSFIDQPGLKVSRNYFVNRLGLQDFNISQWASPQPTSFQRVTALFHRRPAFDFVAEHADNLVGRIPLPAAVIFGAPAEISDIYKKQYKNLKARSFLLAEQQGGGTNKLLRNFAIHNNSLLLITGKTMLNFLHNIQQVQPVANLKVKTLGFVVDDIIEEQTPYTKALAAQYENPVQDYYLPKALADFQSILQFFHTPVLKQIYVLEGKKPFKHKAIYQQCLELILKSGD